VNERTCPIHPRQVKQHWKSEMRLKKDRTGHAMGRPRRESSVVGDPGAKFFWETRGRAQKQETRNKKETEATDVSQTAIHLTKARFLSAEPSPPQTVRSRVQWPVLTRPQMAGFEVTTEASLAGTIAGCAIRLQIVDSKGNVSSEVLVRSTPAHFKAYADLMKSNLSREFANWGASCSTPEQLQKRGATIQAGEAAQTACKQALAEREKFTPIFKRTMLQRVGLKSFKRRRKLIGRLSLTRRIEFNETASPLPVPSLQTSRPPLRPFPGQNASVPSSSRSRSMFLGNAPSSLLH
jgi:hypothetical protein